MCDWGGGPNEMANYLPTTASSGDVPRSGRITAPDVLGKLTAKIAGMELHDDTGDPHDEGYTAAVQEIKDWIASEPWR